MRYALSLPLALTTIALSACGLPEEATAPEEVATTQSPLCTDGAPDKTVAFVEEGGFLGGESAQPSSAYDRASCADSYVVEVTGTLGKDYDIVGGWADALPNTKEACPFALATVAWYGQRLKLTCNGVLCTTSLVWTQDGSATLSGKWTDGPFGGCSLVSSGAALPHINNGSARKVRVAVKAAALAVFFPVYKRAAAGVHSQQIPH